MKKFLSVLTGFAFLMATIFNVALHGYDPATTAGLISGIGFCIATILDI